MVARKITYTTCPITGELLLVSTSFPLSRPTTDKKILNDAHNIQGVTDDNLDTIALGHAPCTSAQSNGEPTTQRTDEIYTNTHCIPSNCGPDYWRTGYLGYSATPLPRIPDDQATPQQHALPDISSSTSITKSTIATPYLSANHGEAYWRTGYMGCTSTPSNGDGTMGHGSVNGASSSAEDKSGTTVSDSATVGVFRARSRYGMCRFL